MLDPVSQEVTDEGIQRSLDAAASNLMTKHTVVNFVISFGKVYLNHIEILTRFKSIEDAVIVSQ